MTSPFALAAEVTTTPTRSLGPCLIARSTTVFLDRDGVINRRVPHGYVLEPSEFEFLPGALNALSLLAPLAGPVVVVTNQQGVALNLMTENDLDEIHAVMTADVHDSGGRIDAVLTCHHRAGHGCGCRKPAPGLLLRAAREVAAVDLSDAVLVGDSPSDLLAAANASPEIGRVQISPPGEEDGLAQAAYTDLMSWVQAVSRQQVPA